TRRCSSSAAAQPDRLLVAPAGLEEPDAHTESRRDLYLMPFFNTKDAGPMVLEIPPADDGVINGTIMDAWQVPLEDVGPAGVDKGKGGKYLILPPSHSAAVPAGFIALPSNDYQGYALLRSILQSGSDADVSKA